MSNGLDFLLSLVLQVFNVLFSKASGTTRSKILKFIVAFVTAIFLAPLCWYVISMALPSARQAHFELMLQQTCFFIPILFILFFTAVFLTLDFMERKITEGQTEQQFTAVRHLVMNQQYSEARRLLSTINNPKARKWEVELNKQQPHDPDFLNHLEQH